jgi:YidC/Oxa1 family membrane protein insertase
MNIFTLLLTQPLANGLILFYKVLGQNMGLAIIGFSLFLRIILNPLTKPYMESMKKMKDMTPQIDRLKKKYKDDKIKFTQAQADLYKEKGINPGAGCLPYLLQIVILIAFFNVFTRTLSPDGDPTGRFNDLLYGFLKFEPGQSINLNFLYLDITKPDILKFAFLPFAIPGPFLILAALSQFVSAKVMTPFTDVEEKIAKATKDEADDMQVAMQKSMSFTFPLFTLFIGMKFASGLALYWVVFSLSQTIQQVRSQGWGELTPLIKKLNLLKLES